MTTYETEACRSAGCGQPIIWAETEAGKAMPVDAEPTADGTVRLRARDGRAPLAVVLQVAERFGKTGLRKSHFATCPDADSWRRKRVTA